ncbi:MAG: hypothetical protein CVU69_03080 [Deltaproteobacteria bacterium HGW-Deltaproteobacteria-4]|nr:MAG: hypothetical protein CVU69_03080 [Deltaproteobacteria bacterium HGW-Deltaproteobacteria-4]
MPVFFRRRRAFFVGMSSSTTKQKAPPATQATAKKEKKVKKTNSSNIRHYFKHLTCTLFVVLGLLGIFAPASQAATGAFAFSTATYSVDEDAGKVSITINRVGGSTGAASVSFRTNPISAAAGSDFVNIPLTTLNFAHRERQKVVSVNIINDTVVEPDETFEVLLSNPTYGTTLGKISTSVITIQDNDIAPVNSAIDTTAPSAALTSPANPTTLTTAQTVTIAASATDNVGVSKVELYEGTTLKGTDTTAPYSFAWAITSANNGNHSFTAKAYDAAGNVKISAATAVTVNIPVAVAAPGAFTFSAANYSVGEGGGKVNITINRVGGSAGIATIDWKTQGVTATFTKDYGDFDWTTLTFADGETSKVQSINIVDDTLVEGNETFNVLLSNATGGAALGSITTTVVTIQDNDTVTAVSADTTAPTVSLTSPANSATFTTAQTVTITASASDNVGVSKVELYDGTTLKSTDTTAPYSFSWTISSASNGSHSLTAKAYDVAGNSKVSGAVTVTVNISAPVVSGPVKVFPGAEGFGTDSVAGRGGQIIKVTNLNDSGAGSLRAAIATAGARVIVFEVGGHIKLQSDLIISQPYVTIAGQTAPFPGIQISGGRITIQTHNVLMQHIRARYGDYSGTNETHSMRIISGAYKVVVDHCTFMWADDEVASIWTNDKSMYDITLSNSIVAEGLGSHGYGTIVGAKYAPSPGPNWVNKISLVKNLYAHNHERSPSLSRDVNAVVINNLSYNAQWEFMALGLNNGPTTASIIGNHFITGSANYGGAAIGVAATGVGSKIYQSDNRVTGPYSRNVFSDGTGSAVVSQPPLVDGTTILPGSTVKDYVLRNVGAWPAYRDSAETRVIDEVRNGTGFHKNKISEAGGWPTEYNSMTSRSLSSLLPANPNGDDDGNGYTNIEEFLYKMAAQVEGRL